MAVFQTSDCCKKRMLNFSPVIVSRNSMTLKQVSRKSLLFPNCINVDGIGYHAYRWIWIFAIIFWKHLKPLLSWSFSSEFVSFMAICKRALLFICCIYQCITWRNLYFIIHGKWSKGMVRAWTIFMWSLTLYQISNKAYWIQRSQKNITDQQW